MSLNFLIIFGILQILWAMFVPWIFLELLDFCFLSSVVWKTDKINLPSQPSKDSSFLDILMALVHTRLLLLQCQSHSKNEGIPRSHVSHYSQMLGCCFLNKYVVAIVITERSFVCSPPQSQIARFVQASNRMRKKVPRFTKIYVSPFKTLCSGESSPEGNFQNFERLGIMNIY